MKGQEKPKKLTDAQTLLKIHLAELGITTIPEYKFSAERDWRFDLAAPHMKLAFEANGGKWHGGHRRGEAIEDENDKLNRATLGGWRVLVFTNEQILDGRAKQFIKEYL